MIYRKLNKLEHQKRDIISLIDAAYNSSADPEIVMFRVNDLQWDLDVIEKEIEEERMFIGFKWGLALFIASSMSLIIYGLILSL
jgi:hypothetical protein